jgi:hypothetical protein
MVHLRSSVVRVVVTVLVAVLFLSSIFSPTQEAQAAGGSFGGGDGTAGNPYLIEDVLDLQAMNNKLTAHYALKNDIDASATSSWNSGAGFVPIAGNDSTLTPVNKFTGSFDGKGYTITGLYISRPDKYNVGLFGHIGDNTAATVIKDVNLVDTTVTGIRGVGTLIGRVTGNANTIIERCSSIGGSVTGNGATGGLIGSHNSWQETPGGTDNPIASRCFADVHVSYSALSLSGSDDKGDKFGGLAGCSQKGTITNSFARGDVTHTGGSPSSAIRIGGLAGCILYRGQIIDSYSTGLVTTDSGRMQVGGLVGNVGTGGNAGTATNSFWDAETSGQPSSAGGTGKTTTQMKTESTFTDVGWDFADIWEIISGENDGYPCLRWYCDPPASTEFTNDPPYYTFGLVEESGTYESGLDHFTITNTGDHTINITIHGTDMIGGSTTWTLSDSATPGTDIFGLKAGLEGGAYNVIVRKTAIFNTLKSSLATGATQKWGLQLLAPSSFSDYIQKSGTVILTATAA